jgi:RNA polymerase sigma-32 factor
LILVLKKFYAGIFMSFSINPFARDLCKPGPLFSTPEEEASAVRAWRRGDQRAGKRIMEAFLFYLRKEARRWQSTRLAPEDILSEAKVGFCDALKKGCLDPRKGSLKTYAKKWVTGAIGDYVRENGHGVFSFPASKEIKKAFSLLPKIKDTLKAHRGALNDPQRDRLAARLETTREIIDIGIEIIVVARPVRFMETPLSDDSIFTLHDTHADEMAVSPEDTMLHKAATDMRSRFLAAAIQTLEPVERDIFVQRRLTEQPLSRAELGKIHNLSFGTVRQIEEQAFRKVGERTRAAVQRLDQGIAPADVLASFKAMETALPAAGPLHQAGLIELVGRADMGDGPDILLPNHINHRPRAHDHHLT